jgi:signal transduction histidine kinase
MSPRTLKTVLASLGAVTCSLLLSMVFGLQEIAALPETARSGLLIWGIVAPLLAFIASTAMVLRGHHQLRDGIAPGQLAVLPTRVLLTYVLVAAGVALVGGVLEPSTLWDQRPYAVLLGGPSLVVAHVLLLRALIVPPWTVELTRLATQQEGEASRRPRLSRAGVLALSPALTLFAAAAAMVALALIGLHIHSAATAQEQAQAELHLGDLLKIARAQLKRLPPDRAQDFFSTYPISGYGVPVLVSHPDGRTNTETPGLPLGSLLTIDRGRCSTERGHTTPCLAAAPDTAAGHRLVVIVPPDRPSSSSALGTHLLLVALSLFFFAVLLGRAIGKDISRDFTQIANQVRAMASRDELDLGRPVTVTSIDEVGDLTASLGRLRTQLETEHEAHQEALRRTREADRIKNEFFSDVSRELRTPLTTLCGYAQLLKEQSPGPLNETQIEDVDSIHRGGLQLLGLVNDVLDISVIESGFLKLNAERCDVGALCEELVKGQRLALKARYGSKAVALELELTPGLPQINADPRRLQQVVHNLLSNAIKFTSEGTITVTVARATPRGEGIRVDVADTGIGIGASDLPDVFDHYRQAGDLNMRRQGSGLGLAISKHLVDLHGGTLSVSSEVNRGSTFTIVLPLDAVSSASGRHLSMPQQTVAAQVEAETEDREASS